MIARLGALAMLAAGAMQPAGPEPPRLEIDVKMPVESTGTMHYASRVTIGLPGVKPIVDSGYPTPIFGDQVALSATRYLVLGWSSTEGTNQTITVEVVERHGNSLASGPSLRFTSSRPDSRVLVRKDAGKVLVGVTAPAAPLPDSTYEDPWEVHYGHRTLTLRDALRVRAERLAPAASDHVYSGATPPPPPPDRVIWFELGPNGFARATSG